MKITMLLTSLLVGSSIFAASSVSPALADGQNNAAMMQLLQQQQMAAQVQAQQVPLNQRPEVLSDPTFNPLANPRVNPVTAAQYGNYFDPTSPAGYVKGTPNQLPSAYANPYLNISGYPNPYLNTSGYPNPYMNNAGYSKQYLNAFGYPYTINSSAQVKRWKRHHR